MGRRLCNAPSETDGVPHPAPPSGDADIRIYNYTIFYMKMEDIKINYFFRGRTGIKFRHIL